MGRTLFPTKNTMGVRVLSGWTLAGDDYANFRAPAEPAPRAASNPVTLGVIPMPPQPSRVNYWGGDPVHAIMSPGVTPSGVPPQPSPTPPTVTPSPSGSPPAMPVSQQSTPTPTVNLPQITPTNAVLVTSGGGTVSPNVSPAAPAATYTTDASGDIMNVQTGQMVMTAAQAAAAGITAQSLTAGTSASDAATVAAATAAAPTDVTDQVAAWLGGTTAIAGYSVPNPILVGVVVLGFALLMGGGGKKK